MLQHSQQLPLELVHVNLLLLRHLQEEDVQNPVPRLHLLKLDLQKVLLPKQVRPAEELSKLELWWNLKTSFKLQVKHSKQDLNERPLLDLYL